MDYTFSNKGYTTVAYGIGGVIAHQEHTVYLLDMVANIIQEKKPYLVLDVSKIMLYNTVFLQLITHINRKLLDAGGYFIIIPASQQLLFALGKMKMNQQIPVCDSVEKALAMVSYKKKEYEHVRSC